MNGKVRLYDSTGICLLVTQIDIAGIYPGALLWKDEVFTFANVQPDPSRGRHYVKARTAVLQD